MKRKQFICAAISLVALSGSLLTGCAKKGGGEYLGKWEDKDRHMATMTISQNGDGYLISMVNNATGTQSGNTIPATYKDGVLNFPNGPATGSITYVKTDDSVLVSGFAGTLTFVRVK
jgi:hypothetical protein